MALNFPNSPSLNDTHTHNGLTWVWNGSVWEMQGSGGASVTVSDNAPSSPTHGDMWWESDTGDLKIYYDESETGAGSGAFWVSANGADSMVGISTTAPTNPQTGDLWWDSDVAALYMYYNDGNSSQWVSAASGATGAQGSVGDAGVAGAQGSQGHQGAAGAAGAQGATGAQGAAGATGSQGATGSTGAQGAAGATGSQGAAGATGSQGATGSTGAQGSTGPVAGSSTQVVYKDGSNNPAGSTNLTFDGTNLIVGGNLNVGGVLTYEDVTNIDSVGVVTARAGVKVPDSQKIFLGTGDDLQIYHDGSNSRIDNSLGSLIIKNNANDQDVVLSTDNGSGSTTTYVNCDGSDGKVKLYHYGSEKLQTRSDGVLVTGELQSSSLDVDGNVDFDSSKITFDSGGNVLKWADNVAAYFGTGNDLRIYHDGNNSFIKDAGTGRLTIATSQLQLTNAADSAVMIRATESSLVELFHNGSKKLETTSSGVTVTGGLQSQRLVVTDNGAISPLASIRADDQSPWALTIGNDTYSTSDRGISFYQSNAGDGYMRMRGDGAWENFYLQMNDGTTTHTAIHIDTNRAVNLKYQNVNKLQTKSDGVDITGEVQCDSLDCDGSADFTGDVAFRGGANAVEIASNSDIRLINGSWTGDYGAKIQHHGNALYIQGGSNGIIFRAPNGTDRAQIDSNGHLIPNGSNTYDLGSSTYRWRDIYTMDLQLSNEARKDTGGNDVDGTWGDWTLQEGEDDIFMINNRNGKKFRIKMEEV